ncbi:MAG: Hpt domain-containing protein [Methylococcaceae bacterium]
MIAIFLTEAPQQLHELTRYQAQGKLPESAATAHALKGSVGHFYSVQTQVCTPN